MKIYLILICAFLMPSVAASEVKTKSVPLDNGVELHIRQIQFSRILPHAYYDQAIASIPRVYPDSQIIAKRRQGYLAKNPAAVYSMVCYKKSKNQTEVTVSGVVTVKNKAWSFDAGVDESEFADTLILVMEMIADVPFNNALQPAAE